MDDFVLTLDGLLIDLAGILSGASTSGGETVNGESRPSVIVNP
jgi:hypothetical protein